MGIFGLFFFFLGVVFPARGQDNQARFDVSCTIDWIRGELSAEAGFDLAGAGITLPTGRFLAEETLEEALPLLLLPYLLSLRVDSNSIIRNLADQLEVSPEELDILCRKEGKITPSLSTDLKRMNGRFTLPLEKISALLARHTRHSEPARPLLPVQTASYTGIIIIADKELPVHGRKALEFMKPCIFPKIWDSDMNLVYDRNMTGTNPIARYTVPENIFRPTPSGLDGDLAAFVGPNPLRILAREVYGIYPSDPVIDREDALKILSNENNRRLLQEGRFVLVLNEKELKHPLP